VAVWVTLPGVIVIFGDGTAVTGVGVSPAVGEGVSV
jgi:hypothetical protein